MSIFYLTIPLMIASIAAAVLPLLWASRRHHELERAARPVPVRVGDRNRRSGTS